MTKQPELKPCPFCGETPLLYLHMGYYRVECQNIECPSRLTASANKKDIITAWNTRLKPNKKSLQTHSVECSKYL